MKSLSDFGLRRLVKMEAEVTSAFDSPVRNRSDYGSASLAACRISVLALAESRPSTFEFIKLYGVMGFWGLQA